MTRLDPPAAAAAAARVLSIFPMGFSPPRLHDISIRVCNFLTAAQLSRTVCGASAVDAIMPDRTRND